MYRACSKHCPRRYSTLFHQLCRTTTYDGSFGTRVWEPTALALNTNAVAARTGQFACGMSATDPQSITGLAIRHSMTAWWAPRIYTEFLSRTSHERSQVRLSPHCYLRNMVVKPVLLLLNGIWLSALGRFYYAVSNRSITTPMLPSLLATGLLMLILELVRLGADSVRTWCWLVKVSPRGDLSRTVASTREVPWALVGRPDGLVLCVPHREGRPAYRLLPSPWEIR